MPFTISGFKYDDQDANGFRATSLIKGKDPDVVLVLDVSGSTYFPFVGSSPVGDLNSDYMPNTVLDAEIAAAQSFHSSLLNQGFGSANLALVSFSDGASTEFNGTASTSTSSGYDFYNRVAGLQLQGGTNYSAGLSTALSVLRGWGSTDGNVIFLSDGEPNWGQDGTSEFAALKAAGYNVQAFGVGTGARKSPLSAIDSDGTAYIFTTPEEVRDVLSGKLGGSIGATQYTEPGLAGVEIYVDLNGNGSFDSGEPSTTSGSDGSYTITTSALSVGQSYAVKEKVPSGYLQTQAPNTLVVTAANQTFKDVNFGNTVDKNPPPVPLPPTANPLAVLSAFVVDDLITLQFDQEVRNSNPSTARFRVVVGDGPARVVSSSVSSSDGQVLLTLDKPVVFGESVTVSYTDMLGDQTFGVIESVDGVDLANLNDLPVENRSQDSKAPEVVDLSVDGKTLTLTLNESLGAEVAPASAFTVRSNGRTISVSEVKSAPDSGLVSLVLSSAVAFGDDVQLSYKDLAGDQATKVLQDKAGNDLATFSNATVVNNTFETTPLAFANATVDGDTLEITFDRDIAATLPSAKTFRVEADGKVINVNRVAVFPSDRQAVLTLGSAVTNKQSVVVSYIDPAGDQRTGVVEDVQGNDLISFTKKPVKNDTVDANPLTLDSAEVLGGNKLVVTLSKELGSSVPSSARFKVLANNKLQAISSIQTSPNDGTVTLNLRSSIPAGASVLLDYTDQLGDQVSGVIEDNSGKDLASVKGFKVNNFVLDEEAPTLVDAEAEGNLLTLYFDEELSGGRVNASAFSIKAGGKRLRARSVKVLEGDTVAELTLSGSVAAGTDVLISYTDPRNDQATGVIQDLAGNDLGSLRDFDVVNLTSGPSKRLISLGSSEISGGRPKSALEELYAGACTSIAI
ncbi:MAG: VWA domain-containing protein [Cyanobacteria bacterium M_surface_10_m1_298]|nr:VWA domain-containing protein [Cyanobacteria bacterium M_surface_10_m1_298]